MQSVFVRKKFWTDYYRVTDTDPDDPEYPELDDLPIELRLSRGHALVVQLEENLFQRSLCLSEPTTGDLISLGWADLDGPLQNVLRWEEIEAVCRCLAARDSALGYPGVPLLLLLPFTPITAADDLRAIRQAIARAWGALGQFSGAEIDELVAETSSWLDERDLRWVRNAEVNAWVAEGEHTQSLRTADNDDFPFKQLDELLYVARSCAAS